MAYGYCRSCDMELDNPSFKEAVQGFIECPICCAGFDLQHDEKEQALVTLEERVAAIEAKLGIQP